MKFLHIKLFQILFEEMTEINKTAENKINIQTSRENFGNFLKKCVDHLGAPTSDCMGL
jgi:hypothetical protein